MPSAPLSNQGGTITLLDEDGLKVHGVSYLKSQAQDGTISFEHATIGLFQAVRANDIARLRQLIKTGGLLLNERDAAGNTALEIAIASNRLQLAGGLIEAGADAPSQILWRALARKLLDQILDEWRIGLKDSRGDAVELLGIVMTRVRPEDEGVESSALLGRPSDPPDSLLLSEWEIPAVLGLIDPDPAAQLSFSEL
jgi:hypothetical protein